MVRSDLIDIIAAENPHLTLQEAERAVVAVFTEITAAMEAGGRVELRGFGIFSVREREARVSRNPRTGEPVDVVQKHVPFFKVGKQLYKRLNGGA